MESEEVIVVWMEKIDERIQALDLKLDTLAPLPRVEALEKQNQYRKLTQTGIAAGATTVGLYLKSLFT